MLLQELETAEQAGKLPSWFAWKILRGWGVGLGMMIMGGGGYEIGSMDWIASGFDKD